MNSTILMIAFVLGIVVWLMVLTGLTDKTKKETKEALVAANRVKDMFSAYYKEVSDTIQIAKQVNKTAQDILNYDKQLVNRIAEIDKSMKVTAGKIEITNKESSNDREQDEEDGDDLEGGDPETTGQGSS